MSERNERKYINNTHLLSGETSNYSRFISIAVHACLTPHQEETAI